MGHEKECFFDVSELFAVNLGYARGELCGIIYCSIDTIVSAVQ